MKIDVNVPTESNKHKQIGGIFFAFWKSLMKRAGTGSGSINQVYGSMDSDPYQNVMVPEHSRKSLDVNPLFDRLYA